MLAAIHHNNNIDMERSGNRVIERISGRRSRANDAPSYRVHKTQCFDWKINFIKIINSRAILSQIGSNLEMNELEEEMADIVLNDFENFENDEAADIIFDNYFNFL